MASKNPTSGELRLKPSRDILFLALTLLMAGSCGESVRQNVHASSLTLLRRLGFGGMPPVLVDLSAEEMARIGQETQAVKGIYFSDFVEVENSNHIRPAAAFRETTDTILTDQRIPLSTITGFYGVEDGKVKSGRLDQFRDSTVVLPVRNPFYGYVAGIQVTQELSFWQRIYIRPPFRVLKARRELRQQLREMEQEGSLPPGSSSRASVRRQLPIVSAYPGGVQVKVIGTDGRPFEEPTIQAALGGKIFLADSLGHAVFINRLNSLGPGELQQLNALLAAHPLRPVIVDNGRYARYALEKGSYREYVWQDLCRPDSSLYVVGSVLR